MIENPKEMDVEEIQKLKDQGDLVKLAKLANNWDNLLENAPNLSDEKLYPDIAFCHALASEIVSNLGKSPLTSSRAKFYLAEIKLVVYSLTGVKKEADEAITMLNELSNRRGWIYINSEPLDLKAHLNFFEKYRKEIAESFGNETVDELGRMLTPNSLDDFIKTFTQDSLNL